MFEEISDTMKWKVVEEGVKTHQFDWGDINMISVRLWIKTKFDKVAPLIIILRNGTFLVQTVHPIQASLYDPMIILDIRQEIFLIFLRLFVIISWLVANQILGLWTLLVVPTLRSTCLCNTFKHSIFPQWDHTYFTSRTLTFLFTSRWNWLFNWILWIVPFGCLCINNEPIVNLQLIFYMTPIQNVHDTFFKFSSLGFISTLKFRRHLKSIFRSWLLCII